ENKSLGRRRSGSGLAANRAALPPRAKARRRGYPTSGVGCVTMVEVCYSVYTSSMALSIKSDDADRLARELAAETGETLTEAVETALRERLDPEHARHAASMRKGPKSLAAQRVADGWTAEEIIGYDDAGLPR